MDIREISKLISQIEDTDTLREVGNLVRRRWGDLQRRAVYTFRVGDRVEWDSKYGRTDRGVVTKINQKTVSLRADSGVLWKVSANLLRLSTTNKPRTEKPIDL